MTPERIVVRAPNWLGDCVLSLAALRDVRRQFPGARLEVQARRSVADLYGAVPEIDCVIPSGCFRDDVTGNAYAAKIERDVTEGIRNGVNATPKFYVNGERIDGKVPLDPAGIGLSLDVVAEPSDVQVEVRGIVKEGAEVEA